MCGPKRRKNLETSLNQSQHGTLTGSSFSPSWYNEKICWGRGCNSLLLFQSFVFKVRSAFLFNTYSMFILPGHPGRDPGMVNR